MTTNNACFHRLSILMVFAALYAVMQNLCDDRSSCSVLASPETFNEDPCQGTPKYLEVHYKCRPSDLKRLTACEGDEMNISCAKGVIAIYSAMFGRTPNGTQQCPANKHGYIDCQATNTVSEVNSLCYKKKNCAIGANESLFGDPCPDGTNKYLSVTFACVPRKILKPMNGKTNHRKKKKKKKGPTSTTHSSEGYNITESLVTLSPYVASSQSELLEPDLDKVTESLSSMLQDHVDQTTAETYLQEKTVKPVTYYEKDEPEISSVHENIAHDRKAPGDDSTTNSNDNGAYYKSFEDVTSSEILPAMDRVSKDNGGRESGGKKLDNDIRRHGANYSTKNNVDQSNIEESNSHTGSSLDSKKDNGESSQPPPPEPMTTQSHGAVTTPIHVVQNNKDHVHKVNQTRSAGPSQPADKTESTYVTERNLTVLCSNFTPDVRWTGMQKPPDHRTMGFLKDWFTIFHYLQTQEEKAWLYFTLGICFGIIVLLVVVLVKVCINFHRNIQARLDVSEPTHRSAHINNHSSLDAPMLEHSDSMDRIEVVRFSPRSTLRSLRSDSHDRNLVNYYG